MLFLALYIYSHQIISGFDCSRNSVDLWFHRYAKSKFKSWDGFSNSQTCPKRNPQVINYSFSSGEKSESWKAATSKKNCQVGLSFPFWKCFPPLTQEVSVEISDFLALWFTGICTGPAINFKRKKKKRFALKLWGSKTHKILKSYLPN